MATVCRALKFTNLPYAGLFGSRAAHSDPAWPGVENDTRLLAALTAPVVRPSLLWHTQSCYHLSLDLQVRARTRGCRAQKQLSVAYCSFSLSLLSHKLSHFVCKPLTSLCLLTAVFRLNCAHHEKCSVERGKWLTFCHNQSLPSEERPFNWTILRKILSNFANIKCKGQTLSWWGIKCYNCVDRSMYCVQKVFLQV